MALVVDLCKGTWWSGAGLKRNHFQPLISGHTAGVYTISCVLPSTLKNEFSVEVEVSATVYDVKTVIVKEDKAQHDINPEKLDLYQVDIQGSPKAK
jgi:hypothetical protein